MSGEHVSLIEDSTEEREEIQQAEPEITSKNHEESKITFEELGVASDKQLLGELQPEAKVNVREDRGAVKNDELKVTAKSQLLRELNQSNVNVRDTHKKVEIQKVSKIMVPKREYRREHFEPRELSIGPIHAADSNLFKKDLKLKLAAYFIEPTGKTADELLNSFKAEFKDIRTHFDEDIIMSCTDDELILLVFLDGCAMLGFIRSYIIEDLNKFDISNRQAELIRQDLILMENQIPFTVLNKLMHCINGMLEYEFCILEFIHAKSIIPKDILELIFDHEESLFGKVNGTKQPDHFFDLYRRILLTIPHDSHNCFDTLLSFVGSTFRYVLSLLGVLISFVMERFDIQTDYTTDRIRRMHSFRNIQELKTAGKLSIPALVVDDSTERMLLNLVAYEMCLTNENDSGVTSYLTLLDAVIDNEQDVKDLRAAGILQNHLSSDIDVAQLINRMGSNCFAPSKDTYKDVKEEIEKHYKRRCAIWTAQVCHSHFSSPWTILALFAATAVLGLTVVQTYYAVNQKN